VLFRSGYVEVARSLSGEFSARRTNHPLSVRTDIFGQMTDRALLTVRVQRGDTIGSILREQGIDRFDAEAAVSALRARFNPRRLKAGQTISVLPEDRPTGRIGLAGLAVHMANGQVVEVVRVGDKSFKARRTSRFSLGANRIPTPVGSANQTTATEGRIQTVKIARGDTLMRVLTRTGAPRSAADKAIIALRQHYDPRRLKPDQEIGVMTRVDAGRTVLTGMTITLDSSIYIQVLLNADQQFVVVKSNEPLHVLRHVPMDSTSQRTAEAPTEIEAAPVAAAPEQVTPPLAEPLRVAESLRVAKPQPVAAPQVATKPALVTPLAKPQITLARTETKSEPAAVVAPAEPPVPAQQENQATPADSSDATLLVVNVRRGDTLMAILRRAGFDRHEADQAIRSMRKVFNPRRLSIGQEITLVSSIDPTGGTTLEGVSVKLKDNRYAQVTRMDEKRFGAKRVDELRPINLAALPKPVLKPADNAVAAAEVPRLGQGRAMLGAAVAAAAPRILDGTEIKTARASNAQVNPADALLAIEPAAAAPIANLVRKAVVIGKGDTLYVALTRAGTGREEAERAIAAFRKVHNPRKLQIGQTLSLAFESSENSTGKMRLAEIALDIAPDRDVVVKLGGDGQFLSKEIERPLVHSLERAVGSITTNLYDAATQAGLPIDVLMETMHIFSYDVDFQQIGRAHV